MRRQLVMPICSGILIAIACSYFALPRLAKSQEAPANKATIELKDIDAIKLLAVSFERAYNAANCRRRKFSNLSNSLAHGKHPARGRRSNSN